MVLAIPLHNNYQFELDIIELFLNVNYNWFRKDERTVIKMLLKLFVYPIMFVVKMFELFIKLTMNVSSFVIGLLMTILIVGGIYTIVVQKWTQLLILSIMFAGCMLVIFLAAWLSVTLEDINLRLANLVK